MLLKNTIKSIIKIIKISHIVKIIIEPKIQKQENFEEVLLVFIMLF